MTRTKKNLMLLCFSAAFLFSCAGKETSSSESSKEEESPISEASSEESADIEVNDIASAFRALSKARNFTVTTTEYSGTYTAVNHDYYTEDYFYDDYEGDEFGYAYKDGDVYRFDAYQGAFVLGEAIKDEEGKPYPSLYEAGVVPTLNFPEKAYAAGEGKKVLIINNKQAKLQYLAFMQIDNSCYDDLTELSATLHGDGLETLEILAKFGNTTIYSNEFSAFGTTSVPAVMAFLENAEPYEAPDAFLEMRDCLRTNNFTHILKDSLTYSSSAKEIGREYYLPTYWYVNYLTQSIGQTSVGYLSLHSKVLKSGATSFVYDGAYMFWMDSDLSAVTSMLVGPEGQPSFTTKIYNMIDIMDYPSKFIGLDKPSFFEQTFDKNYPNADVFVTYDTAILLDFARISQISNSFEEGTSLYVHSLEIAFEAGADDDRDALEDDTVTFLFTISDGVTRYDCEYIYADFGASNLVGVEEYLDQFEDYNPVK